MADAVGNFGLKTIDLGALDPVGRDWVFHRILRHIAKQYFAFDEVELKGIEKSAGMISLGDPTNTKVQALAKTIDECDVLTRQSNESLFMPLCWKVGCPEAMVCKYGVQPERLCDAMNAMVMRYNAHKVVDSIVRSEQAVQENDSYIYRG